MARVEHVIYKRCVPGDRLKVENKSQKAGSGGGARDLRFNPLKMFKTVIPKTFTETRSNSRGRQFNSAPVYWPEGKKTEGPIEVELWSPTNSRGGEIRLSTVYKVTPFDKHHLPPAELDPFFF